jgi:hypothetical protein
MEDSLASFHVTGKESLIRKVPLDDLETRRRFHAAAGKHSDGATLVNEAAQKLAAQVACSPGQKNAG